MWIRVEYWSPITADWWVGHKGLELQDPEKYVTKVTDKGRIARAVEIDTDKVIYPTGYGADVL